MKVKNAILIEHLDNQLAEIRKQIKKHEAIINSIKAPKRFKANSKNILNKLITEKNLIQNEIAELILLN